MFRFNKLKKIALKLPNKIEDMDKDYNWIKTFKPEAFVGCDSEHIYQNVRFFKQTEECLKEFTLSQNIEKLDLMYKHTIYEMDKMIYLYLRYHSNIKKVYIIKPLQCTNSYKGKEAYYFDFEYIVAFE